MSLSVNAGPSVAASRLILPFRATLNVARHVLLLSAVFSFRFGLGSQESHVVDINRKLQICKPGIAVQP